MAIWLLGGGVALDLLTSTPPSDGDSDRFDIFFRVERQVREAKALSASAGHVQESRPRTFALF